MCQAKRCQHLVSIYIWLLSCCTSSLMCCVWMWFYKFVWIFHWRLCVASIFTILINCFILTFNMWVLSTYSTVCSWYVRCDKKSSVVSPVNVLNTQELHFQSHLLHQEVNTVYTTYNSPASNPGHQLSFHFTTYLTDEHILFTEKHQWLTKENNKNIPYINCPWQKKSLIISCLSTNQPTLLYGLH